MQQHLSEPSSVPSAGGDQAASLIAIIWNHFCARQVWPTWAEADQELYRAGVRFEDARDELALDLVSGIDSRGRMLPSPDQRLRLTIAGIATCHPDGDHARTFMALLQYAVMLERGWDYTSGEQPRFSFEEVRRSVAIDPGSHGQTVLRQVLSVVDVEPWCGGYGGDGDDRKFVVTRSVREFVDLKSLAAYWQVRSRLIRPTDLAVPVPVPTQAPVQDSAHDATEGMFAGSAVMKPDDEADDAEIEPWSDPRVSRALVAAVANQMPAQSLALYARWWQLETWLRELAYVELRGRYGAAWVDAVKAASGRQQQDAAFTHMSGADNENPLAYLDYSQLLEVMGRHWDQFAYALLEQGSWNGRQDELKRIRHRIGHLRRPHADDLGRLEQTLRDLERGTFIALASYNRRRFVDEQKHDDPVTRGWIRGEHPTAKRLLQHAERQYETTLLVRTSRRPWAPQPERLAQAPGTFWHASFYMRGRTVDVRRLWYDSCLQSVRPLLVHLLADDPMHVAFTFSAADDPEAISNAIGDAFDAVLSVSRRGEPDDHYLDRWQDRARGIDYRVLTESGWNIVDESTVPISNFGAGGQTESSPAW
ncbi:Swt1 family HEPN domain-containing protein [Micromonospora purpureochromogenes]|uniref:Swt1 family HEPN domain-containing protein n=1 Tax=Micromonospora purpureochromogenes TaxID=47872 RepID=UPI00362C50A8